MKEEKHPTTKDFVAGLFELAKENGVKLDWLNCGLCVDERGASGSALPPGHPPMTPSPETPEKLPRASN